MKDVTREEADVEEEDDDDDGDDAFVSVSMSIDDSHVSFVIGLIKMTSPSLFA